MAHRKTKPNKYPKSDVRYWASSVKRRRATSDYSIRIQFGGERDWFNTGKSQKTQAGYRAKEIYDFLRSNGWDEARRRYKPKSELKSENPTFGEFFQALREHSTIENNTLEIYFGKCRTLISGALNIRKDNAVHHSKGNERKKWAEKVEGFRVSKLKPQHVQRWKKKRIEEAKTPDAKEKARSTINSILRNCKSLFSPRIQKALDGVFPNFPWTNPITEADFERVRLSKYRSALEKHGGIELLMTAAMRELQPEIPEIDLENLRSSKAARREAIGKHQQFKILILALGAGLRRKEIDTLRWQQLDFSNNTIRIETNELTRAKSGESEGEIDVQPELMDKLRLHKQEATGDFVIEGRHIEGPYKNIYQYRCDQHFKRLIQWLRGRGVEDKKPLHALRKEFGSEMIKEAGIYEASRQLRHSDIRTTTNHYAYKKNRATVILFKSESENVTKTG